jgi:DNA-binding MarR family transcriptional regulator
MRPRVPQRSAPPPTPVVRQSGCGLLMVRLGRAASVRLAAALEALDMRPHEFAVLHQLAQAGPSSQQRLGETLRVHPSNLVAILDGLEAEGLVVRPRDPSDRRRHLVEVTPSGRRRLARAERATHDVERELLEPLDERERRALASQLARLAAHACRVRGSGQSC